MALTVEQGTAVWVTHADEAWVAGTVLRAVCGWVGAGRRGARACTQSEALGSSCWCASLPRYVGGARGRSWAWRVSEGQGKGVMVCLVRADGA